eukprot:scaffold464_cov181-Amphora_coffeaeformis.AAC.10
MSRETAVIAGSTEDVSAGCREEFLVTDTSQIVLHEPLLGMLTVLFFGYCTSHGESHLREMERVKFGTALQLDLTMANSHPPDSVKTGDRFAILNSSNATTMSRHHFLVAFCAPPTPTDDCVLEVPHQEPHPRPECRYPPWWELPPWTLIVLRDSWVSTLACCEMTIDLARNFDAACTPNLLVPAVASSAEYHPVTVPRFLDRWPSCSKCRGYPRNTGHSTRHRRPLHRGHLEVVHQSRLNKFLPNTDSTNPWVTAQSTSHPPRWTGLPTWV